MQSKQPKRLRSDDDAVVAVTEPGRILFHIERREVIATIEEDYRANVDPVPLAFETIGHYVNPERMTLKSGQVMSLGFEFGGSKFEVNVSRKGE